MSEKYPCQVTLRPQLDHCRRGKAKVHILDFKTTWSEFQKASRTDTKGGNAELHILNFKETSPLQSLSQAVVCASTPRMYPQSRYFLVTHYCQKFDTQSSKNLLISDLMSVFPSILLCLNLQFTIPVVVLQNLTVKSCLVCVESKKYAFWVTLRSLGSMR